MEHGEFRIGMQFTAPRADMRGERLWQVTDVGTRVITAITVRPGWMAGPPYSQVEIVFDEHDMPVCEPAP